MQITVAVVTAWVQSQDVLYRGRATEALERLVTQQALWRPWFKQSFGAFIFPDIGATRSAGTNGLQDVLQGKD